MEDHFASGAVDRTVKVLLNAPPAVAAKSAPSATGTSDVDISRHPCPENPTIRKQETRSEHKTNQSPLDRPQRPWRPCSVSAFL
jgi:hypothetical protein